MRAGDTSTRKSTTSSEEAVKEVAERRKWRWSQRCSWGRGIAQHQVGRWPMRPKGAGVVGK